VEPLLLHWSFPQQLWCLLHFCWLPVGINELGVIQQYSVLCDTQSIDFSAAKLTVLWDLTPFSFVDGYQWFLVVQGKPLAPSVGYWMTLDGFAVVLVMIYQMRVFQSGIPYCWHPVSQKHYILPIAEVLSFVDYLRTLTADCSGMWMEQKPGFESCFTLLQCITFFVFITWFSFTVFVLLVLL